MTAVRRGAIADVVGHCVVVFAFVPTLAVLPGWLHAEATNALNWHDPIVLAFLPVRGMVALWSAFGAGLVPGIIGGLIAFAPSTNQQTASSDPAATRSAPAPAPAPMAPPKATAPSQ